MDSIDEEEKVILKLAWREIQLSDLHLSGSRSFRKPTHLSEVLRWQIHDGKVVSLHIRRLYGIPVVLTDLPNLKTLTIDLPEGFDPIPVFPYLKGLRVKSVGTGCLKTPHLPSLKVLSLSNLKEVDESVFNLPITRIEMDGLSFRSIGANLGKFPNLREIFAKGVRNIPMDLFSNLPRLKVLALPESRIHLDQTIGKMRELEQLYLWRCELDSLPKEIGLLTNLKILNLNSNNLKEIPREIGNLSKLESLRLANNLITEFPKILKKCPLKEFEFHKNPLKEFPSVLKHFHKLQKIIAYDLPLKTFPTYDSTPQTSSIQFLSCSGFTLPPAIKSFSRLERLVVGHTELKELPSWIATLPSLNHLEIVFSHIRKIPEALSKLQLKSLILSFCLLEELTIDTIPKTLETLTISWTQLKYVPKGLVGFPKLKRIDLSNNQIRKFPEDWKEYQPDVVVNLDGNPIVSLPEGINRNQWKLSTQFPSRSL